MRGSTSTGTAAACARTSDGNSCGISWPWIAASTASVAVSLSPSTASTRPIGGRRASGRLHDLRIPPAVRLRFEARVGRDHDVALDALVVGDDVTDPGFDGETPDQSVEPTLQDFDDRPFATPATIDPGDASKHAIAVHGLAHLERRKEQVVAAAGVRAQEAETIGIGDDDAGDQIHARGRRKSAAAVLQQLSVAQHRTQAFVQGVEAIGLGERELSGKRVRVHRTIGSRQHCRIICRLAIGCS
jgi:hypothetical protein